MKRRIPFFLLGITVLSFMMRTTAFATTPMTDLMEVIPSDIMLKVLMLYLGAIGFVIVSILIVRRRKKLPLELWISGLAICILGAIGMSFVATCVAAAFVIAR